MFNLIDCHSHSNNSIDAENSVDEMCKKAMTLGLSAYAITDHVECCSKTWIFGENEKDREPVYFKDIFENSMRAISVAKEKYGDKLNLLAGLELGEPCHDLEASNAYSNDERLDFIIASVHQMRDYPDFYFMDFNDYDIPSLMEKYFNEIYETCKWGNFDVFGHLTYTLRYMEGKQGFNVDMRPYDDIIHECFKTLIENGKGIEINSSGLRQKYGFTIPKFEYIKMFRDCGGEIISIGSDSHCAEDLGKGISEATDLARQAGFKYISYFKKRKPNFVKIEK